MEPAAPTTQPPARYRLVSAELLRVLMERTGTGASISGRQLAKEVGIPSATVDGLLNGKTRTQPADVAQAIADRIGVALLVLWVPRAQAATVGLPSIAEAS